VPAMKTGPLTREELEQVWSGASDESYRDPLQRAGEGHGFEGWTQLFAQLERSSKAIDVTTQAMFISPWSGQTNPPASGARRSTVTLTISRSGLVDRPLLLAKGQVFAEEETVDYGSTGGVAVRTGRRYVLDEDVFFPPGVRGPQPVDAVAEFSGYGFDNPLPGTIKVLSQPGAVFENVRATVTESVVPADLTGNTRNVTTITAENRPDMFIPDHVGQYVMLVGGTNAGVLARVVDFGAPQPPFQGSSAGLELLYTAIVTGGAGTFSVGETVRISDTVPAIVAYGRVVDYRTVSGTRLLSYVLVTGTVTNVMGHAFVGLTSGATATESARAWRTDLTPEAPVGGVGGASWRMLDWVDDWGIVVTNAASPAGGRSGMLDELGSERKVYRVADEPEEDYRARVREVADVVTPNAIRRALNRTIPGIDWCLREAGTTYRGFFYDGDLSPPSGVGHGADNDSYDNDVFVVQGSNFTVPFIFDERVELRNTTTGLIYATGYMGREENVAGFTYRITVIRKTGALPASLALATLYGMQSGAALTNILSGSVPSTVSARRNRVYFDYEQFRGYFFVSVPNLATGAFGFAFDVTVEDWGWDMPGSYETAFDGYPIQASDVYRRVWQTIDQIRAGGVGWELNQNPGPCP
jgi:hypothetical protein